MILFRPFRTRGVYIDADAFRREIVKEFRSNIGPDLVSMHNETVTHWKVQPVFDARLSVTSAGIGVDIVPTGDPAQLWWWHVEGVPARTIRPRRHRQPKRYYRAKGQRHGGRGRGRRPRAAALKFTGREGFPVYRRSVEWKGIAAMRHPERIAKRYLNTFRRRCENAARRGIRAAQGS
jgi:hypothetical protein